MMIRKALGRVARITSNELPPRERAADYASILDIGDEILIDTDWDTIAPFWIWLPGALADRGFVLLQITGGWRVIQARSEN